MTSQISLSTLDSLICDNMVQADDLHHVLKKSNYGLSDLIAHRERSCALEFLWKGDVFPKLDKLKLLLGGTAFTLHAPLKKLSEYKSISICEEMLPKMKESIQISTAALGDLTIIAKFTDNTTVEIDCEKPVFLKKNTTYQLIIRTSGTEIGAYLNYKSKKLKFYSHEINARKKVGKTINLHFKRSVKNFLPLQVQPDTSNFDTIIHKTEIICSPATPKREKLLKGSPMPLARKKEQLETTFLKSKYLSFSTHEKVVKNHRTPRRFAQNKSYGIIE